MAIRIVFPSASQAPGPVPPAGTIVDAELSFSDGSGVTGTVDIFTGIDGMDTPNSSHPVNFMKLGNTLVFEVTDNTHGRELWVTDGTAAGTHFLADINTVSTTDTHDSTDRSSSWQFSDARIFQFQAPAIFNGFAYFKADDGVNGIELWRTDGTAGGTTLVADINPGGSSSSSSPFLLTPSGDFLYFAATTAAEGTELWKTDGTTTGIVANLVSGNGNSNPDNLTDFNGTLFFTAADESFGPLHLWKTTGGAPEQISGADFASQLTPLGDLLLFNKADNDHGAELWAYDGTTAQMVKNIGTLPTGSNPLPDFGSNPQNLTAFNGFVYFWAQDDTHGYEVWRSDGTEDGTTLFADINTTSPNESSGPGSPFVISGNKLYFLANNGHTGQELWVTDGVDGTAAHTHIVKDIVGGANISSFAGNAFPHLTDVDGTLYFTINDNTANGLYSLYKTDGTEANTTAVAEHIYFPGNSVNPFAFLVTGPVVDLNGEEAEGIDFTAIGFIENGPAVPIADATATLTGSSDITSATITISNMKAGDLLSIAGALPAGISNGGFDSDTGVLTLSGTASSVAYETAIKQVRFSNTSENPDTATRTITVATTDPADATNDPPAVASVDVTAVNDAPVNSVPGSQSAIQNIDKVIAGLAVSDVDAASLIMTLSVLHGTLTVSSVDATGVLGSGTASVTLSGTLAQINATLAAASNVTYKSVPNFHGNDTLTVLTDDGGNTGTGGAQTDTDIVTIAVSAPPAITSNGGGDTATISFVERSTAAVTTVTAADSDSSSLTFSIVDGLDSGKFQINASTGVLSFVTAPNFDVATDADHNNSYIVQVRVSDGVLTDDQFITVNVTDNPNVTSTLHWVRSVDAGAHPAGWAPAGHGDFNADGTTDLAWFNAATGNLDIWKFTNGGLAGSSNAGSHPLGYQPIGFGDYNNNGTDDVIWYNPTTHDVDLWRISDGQWTGSVNIGTHPAGFQPSLIGDFNGDGTSGDILWFNPTTNAVDIWKIGSNGQWAGSVNLGTHPAGFQPALAGDFNGDGTSDVLWYNPVNGQVDIWNISNGQWAGSVAAGAHPLGWQPLGAADFNRDATSDIAWYNPTTNNIDVWLINNSQWKESANVGSHPGAGPESALVRGGLAQPVVAIGVGDVDHNGVADITWHDKGNGHIENWILDYS